MKHRCEVLVCAVALVWAPCRAATVVLADTTFPALDWSFQAVSQGGISSFAAGQAAGGNPGTCQTIRCNFTATAFIHVFAVFTAGGFNPSILGAIDSIDYSEDRRNLLDIQFRDVNDYLALTQNGKVYVYGFPNITSPGTGWANQSVSGLTAGDFDEWGAATGSPDFSTGGGGIQFGYIRGSSTNNTSGDRYTESAIDNWTVTIHHSAIPEPAVAWLLVAGVWSLAGRRRRNRFPAWACDGGPR